MSLVSRNPFARTEIHRESVETKNSCDWCGGYRYRARHGKRINRLFCYSIESDGGRKTAITGLFCSIACMKTYHAWEPL